jgi:serine/threonine-protein kinase
METEPYRDSLSLSAARRVDAACVQFEKALQAGRHPRIEDFLGKRHDPEQAALLYELLRLEGYYRSAALTEEYIGRFPEYQSAIPGWLKAATDSTAGQSAFPSLPGGYENLGKLGEGGMGVVYKARHVQTRHTVAIKRLRADAAASPSAQERFRGEAKTAAALDHPNIVPIYHVGDDFFTMKYIAGESLEAVVQRGPVASRRAAELMVAIARAVHYAHQPKGHKNDQPTAPAKSGDARGIIHRDLKPSNILLDEAGQPHVADFGLARPLDGQPGDTQPGALVGTPSYMSPEQATGSSEQLTEASDIYGLGAVLYALLTGRPPFKGANVADTIEQVRHKLPAVPRLLNAQVDVDLETICLLCLEKDRARRFYKSAAELAEDLENYLAHRGIRGRPPGWVESITQHVTGRHFVNPRTWGAISLWCIAIVWILNTGCDVMVRLQLPVLYHVLNILAVELLLAGVLYYYLGRRRAALTHSERHIVVMIIAQQLGGIGIWLAAGAPSDERIWDVFPAITILYGVIMFLHGSLSWGRYYLIGLAWFALGIAMPLMRGEWGPYAVSILYTVTIGPVAWHLLRVRDAQAEQSQ